MNTIGFRTALHTYGPALDGCNCCHRMVARKIITWVGGAGMVLVVGTRLGDANISFSGLYQTIRTISEPVEICAGSNIRCNQIFGISYNIIIYIFMFYPVSKWFSQLLHSSAIQEDWL
jgi:hypothetical protein